MGAITSNFADLMNPIFSKIFVDALAMGEKPPVMESVFNILTSTHHYEKTSEMGGFGLVPDKDESAAVSYDDFYQGLDKTYTHTTKAMAYRLSEEWVEDELYGMMSKMPKALGKSVRATIETDAANVLNYAETAGYTGKDSKTLLATDHPVGVSGLTQKNRLTTAANLSATSWEQTQIDIKDTTDSRGILLNLKPKKLIYPNELNWTVRKLFGSAKEPGSANNDINPAADDKIQFIEWSYLTDPDAWFVLCEGHMLNWYWRKKPKHERGNDFDTGDAKFKVTFRKSHGWDTPWGVFGSMGG